MCISLVLGLDLKGNFANFQLASYGSKYTYMNGAGEMLVEGEV